MLGTAPVVIVALVLGLVLTLAVALSAHLQALRLRRELWAVRHASRALGNAGLYGLDQLLREQDLHLRRLDQVAGDVERRLSGAEERLAGAIQRVGMIRFNPFRDTGGDQSFVIALLSNQGSGVVVTGLHNRSDTRVYAKPVHNGGSTYPLSDEEMAAIRMALGSSVDGVRA